MKLRFFLFPVLVPLSFKLRDERNMSATTLTPEPSDRIEIELDSVTSTDGLVQLLEATADGIRKQANRRFRINLRIKEIETK